MTNQEWLQSLNKKELAKVIALGTASFDCEICPYNDMECCGELCIKHATEWLEAEHMEDGND